MVTEEMVEAGAKAAWEVENALWRKSGHYTEAWEETDEEWRTEYRHKARMVLAVVEAAKTVAGESA